MKKVDNVYEKLLDRVLLKAAILNAAKDKSESYYVNMVLENL